MEFWILLLVMWNLVITILLRMCYLDTCRAKSQMKSINEDMLDIKINAVVRPPKRKKKLLHG